MTDFKVSNTNIAKSLEFPIVSERYIPTFSSPNPPGTIEFTNFELLGAFYTQVGKNISFSIKFTVDVSAPASEFTGIIFLSPPVRNIVSDYTVGALTTISQVGLFGNLSSQNNNIQVDVRNAVGVINVPGVIMQVLGSYSIE